MKRYHIVNGVPHEDPAGQWVRADEAAELERRLAMATSWLIGEPWEDDAVRIERTDDCRGEYRVLWRRDCRVESELYLTLDAALAAAEGKP